MSKNARNVDTFYMDKEMGSMADLVFALSTGQHGGHRFILLIGFMTLNLNLPLRGI